MTAPTTTIDKLRRMTTPAWEQFKPHVRQSQLWRTTAKFPIVVAGRGSGKTALMRMKIVRKLAEQKPWPDPIYCFGLPTYDQAKRVGWKKILPLIPKEWIKTNNRSELHIETVFGSHLYVVGMDKPHRVEGEQVDGFVLDECSDQRPEAFRLTILPMLTHRDGWCARIGVPKRNGIGASEFKEDFLKGLHPNDAGLESYTWPSSDILTPDQLAFQLANMSEKDAREQFGGVWVEAEGQIYYAYSESGMGNVSPVATYVEGWPIGVGSDFNVNPMCWVLFHYVDGTFYVFDEIYVENTNTQATLDLLYKRYPRHKSGWSFFGDASAKARKTSAAASDYLQIMNDGRFINSRVFYPDSNPAIQDRYASVNAMLQSAVGVRRLFINPKCEKLRKDLESLSYKPGTREPDLSNKKAGHISDALGYPVHSLCGFRAKVPLDKITLSGAHA